MLALVLSFGQLLEVASKLLAKLTCIVESSAKHELLAEPDQQSIANLETKKKLRDSRDPRVRRPHDGQVLPVSV
jgi:hypothetical protein